MKKEYFMLVYSVFFVVVCSFIAGAYFAQGNPDKSLFCLVCALGNGWFGYMWRRKIEMKRRQSRNLNKHDE